MSKHMGREIDPNHPDFGFPPSSDGRPAWLRKQHEPVEPAPQPPADAATPAAPPVSGDGDEAVVREIANRHVSAGNCCFTNTMVLVREALQRGRALGAREADVGALDAAIDWSKYPKLRAIFEHRPRVNVYWLELVKLAADIARRSGGQGK